MRWDTKTLFSCFLLLVSAMFVVIGLQYSPDGRLVPLLVGIPTFLLLLWQFLLDAFPSLSKGGEDKKMDLFGVEQVKETRGTTVEEEMMAVEPAMAARRLKAFVIMLIVYLAASYIIGLLYASLLFLPLFLLMVGEKISTTAYLSLGTWIIVYILFIAILGVPFNEGWIVQFIQ